MELGDLYAKYLEKLYLKKDLKIRWRQEISKIII